MDKWILHTTTGVTVDGSFWFSSHKFNGLFKLDLNSGKIEFVAFFPEEKISSESLHKKCFAYEQYLIFLPMLGDHIHIFDRVSHSFISPSYEVKVADKSFHRIADAVKIKNTIYVLPFNKNDDMLYIELDDFHVHKDALFCQELRKHLSADGYCALTRCNADQYNNICFSPHGTNLLAKWNVERRVFEFENHNSQSLFAAYYFADKWWLLEKRACQIVKHEDNVETVVPDAGKQSNYKLEACYKRIVEFNDYLIGLGMPGKIAVITDENLKCLNADIPNIAGLDFYDAIQAEDELWVFSGSQDDVIAVDKNFNIAHTFKLLFEDPEIITQISDRCIEERGSLAILNESELYSLSGFIDFVGGR